MIFRRLVDLGLAVGRLAVRHPFGKLHRRGPERPALVGHGEEPGPHPRAHERRELEPGRRVIELGRLAGRDVSLGPEVVEVDVEGPALRPLLGEELAGQPVTPADHAPDQCLAVDRRRVVLPGPLVGFVRVVKQCRLLRLSAAHIAFRSG
jgi:hypothetical protein